MADGDGGRRTLEFVKDSNMTVVFNVQSNKKLKSRIVLTVQYILLKNVKIEEKKM